MNRSTAMHVDMGKPKSREKLVYNQLEQAMRKQETNKCSPGQTFLILLI